MAVALRPGFFPRPDDESASRFGSSWDEVLAGVYAAHHDRLVGYFVRRTRDRALAEDLAHDTFVRFVRSSESFDVSRPAWPYLKVTANNVLIDHLRRAERHVDMDVEARLETDETMEPTPDDRVVMRTLLDEAMDLLPERQRIAVDLRYEREWSVLDAAEFLGVSPGTLSQLLFRARQTMRDYLEEVGTSLHGLVLPVVLALRWRWRAWTSRGREMGQTPGMAISMEAVASVVVAATLGMTAVLGPSAMAADDSTQATSAAIDGASVEPREAGVPLPDRSSQGPIASTSSASAVSSAPLNTPEAPSREVASVTTPPVLSDSGGSLEVTEDPERFVVAHEVNTYVGAQLIGTEGDALWIDCGGMLGTVCDVSEMPAVGAP